MQIDLSTLPNISRQHMSASAAVLQAIDEVEDALTGITKLKLGRGGTYFKFRRDLPYVIQGTSLPGTQILVNRQYKPLGSNQLDEGPWLPYEEYPNLHVSLSSDEVRNLCRPLPCALFDDGCPPWDGRKQATQYLGRLRNLFALLAASPSS